MLGLLALPLTHEPSLPINPVLGVPGFPDCTQPALQTGGASAVAANARSLVCTPPQKDFPQQISVACVGDSITAGVHASNGSTTYPAMLQRKLGPGYKVTNLGACGSTMLKGGDSPFWKRPQYEGLTSGTWDIVVIMLGTNDAKDAGSGGPANWPPPLSPRLVRTSSVPAFRGANLLCSGSKPRHRPHNCTGGAELSCPFSKDYASMIELVKTLGTTAAGPEVFVMIPPPLMAACYGMNETVINSVFPTLVPAIAAANKLRGAIDIFNLFDGGDWRDTLVSRLAPCNLYLLASDL